MSEAASMRRPGDFSPLPESFRLELRFTSDWHVGSGVGRPGSVDRLIARDSDELPFVPAKTLTGIWRDSCELVARGLDDGNPDGPWQTWVSELFGDQPGRDARATGLAPRAARLSIRPARLAATLREQLTPMRGVPPLEKQKRTSWVAEQDRRACLRAALTIVRPGIAIDRATGTVRPDHLRFYEFACGGLVLEADAEIDLAGVDGRIASALLLASVSMVERMGGKRRRGAGRCALTIDAAPERDVWLRWLEDHHEEVVPPPPRADHRLAGRAIQPVTAPDRASETWRQIALVLTLELPVCMPSAVVGNVVETLDYVPGTALLGRVTEVAAALGIDLRPAIGAGEVIALDATPQIAGSRGLPAPMALATPKLVGADEGSRHPVNRFVDTLPLDAQGGLVQVVPWRGGWVAPSALAEEGTLPAPPLKLSVELRTHGTIEDERQRPTTDIGGVFSYAAIPAGVTLQSELRLTNRLADALAALKPRWWADLAKKPLRLGRAKKDDYGDVRLIVVDAEEPKAAAPRQFGRVLCVWLVSDVLLRDEALRPDPTIHRLATVLGRALGVSLGPHAAADGLISAELRTHRIDSWQTSWQLPRPSLIGIAGGSCVSFTVTGAIDPERAAAVELAGIGERRAEGFGQIHLQPAVLTAPGRAWRQATPIKGGSDLAPARLSPLDSVLERQGQQIERVAVLAELRRQALASAAKDEFRRTVLGISATRPGMSQLNALRDVVGQVGAPADKNALAWLDRLRLNTRRAEKWPDESLERIKGLLTLPSTLWQHFDFGATPELFDGGLARLRDDPAVWREILVTVIDEIIRAHGRDLDHPASEPTMRGG